MGDHKTPKGKKRVKGEGTEGGCTRSLWVWDEYERVVAVNSMDNSTSIMMFYGETAAHLLYGIGLTDNKQNTRMHCVH